MLGALGSMEGEFPQNLTDFPVAHAPFRTQLLSLLLFVCFSSSSLAFLWPVFPSSPPPLLTHMLTQLSVGPSCWSRALLLHLGTKRGYFHACHVDTKIPFASISSKSAIQCQEVQLVPVHFQLCPGGHQLELMKTRRFFPKCPP